MYGAMLYGAIYVAIFIYMHIDIYIYMYMAPYTYIYIYIYGRLPQINIYKIFFLSKASLIKAVHTHDEDEDGVMNVILHRLVMCP